MSIGVTIVADVNTRWRGRPFEALGDRIPVLGLKPSSSIRSIRDPFFRKTHSLPDHPSFSTLNILLPPGWATHLFPIAQFLLWRQTLCHLRSSRQKPGRVVFTSPHYLALAQRLCLEFPCYYYCSDDYRSYEGWNTRDMVAKEHKLVGMVDRSFFVSKALAQRAVEEFAVAPDKVSVSMNATDECFLQPAPHHLLVSLLNSEPRLKRPIVGVIGVVNDRLDFPLLLACANVSTVGTLLFVGGYDPSFTPGLRPLLSHPKCVFVGNQPNDQLYLWAQLMDVALIPYRENIFNHYCSPMRLFDHLAAGRPILSTRACPQVLEMSPWVTSFDNQTELLPALSDLCHRAPHPRSLEMVNFCRQHTWDARAQALFSVFTHTT